MAGILTDPTIVDGTDGQGVQVVPPLPALAPGENEIGEGESPYQTRVEMRFQSLDDGATMVTIAESGWRENEQGQKSSYLNCEGWSQMLACMKAWVEYGINLREGYYVSELSGKPALEPQL